MEKTILVTGATDGIGRETAHELVRRGNFVIAHGRSKEKLKTVQSELEAIKPNSCEIIAADLSSLTEVKQMASAILQLGKSIDVLLHNAGVYEEELLLTVDGFERTFAVNHLAPFLLTHYLLPSIKKVENSRIIVVSSIAHNRGKIFFDDVNLTQQFDGYRAYAQSKLANILFVNELVERNKNSNTTFYSLHPGVITTKLLQKGFKMQGASLAQGAATSVYLATEPGIENLNGGYFSDKKLTAKADHAENGLDQKRLWELSEKMCSQFID